MLISNSPKLSHQSLLSLLSPNRYWFYVTCFSFLTLPFCYRHFLCFKGWGTYYGWRTTAACMDSKIKIKEGNEKSISLNKAQISEWIFNVLELEIQKCVKMCCCVNLERISEWIFNVPELEIQKCVGHTMCHIDYARLYQQVRRQVKYKQSPPTVNTNNYSWWSQFLSYMYFVETMALSPQVYNHITQCYKVFHYNCLDSINFYFVLPFASICLLEITVAFVTVGRKGDSWKEIYY